MSLFQQLLPFVNSRVSSLGIYQLTIDSISVMTAAHYKERNQLERRTNKCNLSSWLASLLAFIWRVEEEKVEAGCFVTPARSLFLFPLSLLRRSSSSFQSSSATMVIYCDLSSRVFLCVVLILLLCQNEKYKERRYGQNTRP